MYTNLTLLLCDSALCRRSPATPLAGAGTPGPESELERKARELQAKQQTLMMVRGLDESAASSP